jgi:Tfp pilus assembly protein PilN
MKRMPEVRAPGCYPLRPEVLAEFGDPIRQEPSRLKRRPASRDAISRMEETLGWLRWLDADDAKLAWARAERTPWKVICWRFGVGRATANRRWKYSLSLIAWRLNGRVAPAKRSRRFLIERARLLSSRL